MPATESLEEIEKVAARRLKDEIQTAPKPKIVIPLKGKPAPGKTRITGLKDPTAAANFVAGKVEEFVRECEKRVQEEFKQSHSYLKVRYKLRGDLTLKKKSTFNLNATVSPKSDFSPFTVDGLKVSYEVKRGDTLSEISALLTKKFNLSVDRNKIVTAIVSENSETFESITPDFIQTSWKLVMPVKLSDSIKEAEDSINKMAAKPVKKVQVNRFLLAADFIHGEMVGNLKSKNFTAIKENLENGKKIAPINPGAGVPMLAAAYTEWTLLVKPRGLWDHKDFIREIIYRGEKFRPDLEKGDFQYNFDIWSNVHYGYIGKAIGFQDWELLSGAGVAQVIGKVLRKKGQEGKITVGEAIKILIQSALKRLRGDKEAFPKLDDQKDQVAVKIGFRLWQAKGPGVKVDDIVKAVRNKATQLSTEPVSDE